MAGFDNPLWQQIQKIELKPDGTLELPVEADGQHGIVVGEPPSFVPPATAHGPGWLARLRARLRR